MADVISTPMVSGFMLLDIAVCPVAINEEVPEQYNDGGGHFGKNVAAICQYRHERQPSIENTLHEVQNAVVDEQSDDVDGEKLTHQHP